MKGKGSGDFRGKRSQEGEKECTKAMRTDRFDALPDSLLIHILSFLSLKEAAITSVLSKRWEFLWAELPRLEFRGDSLMTEYPSGTIKNKLRNFVGWVNRTLAIRSGNYPRGKIENKLRNFVGWVNRTLAIRSGNYLEKFDVFSLYNKTHSADVDAWVKFAMKHKVKIFGLRFVGPDEFYRLNQEMYSCASLTSLHLERCFLDCKATIEWRPLTNLHLHAVYVDQALLDEILSTCSVLCTLILRHCIGFDRLDINSPRLSTLLIEECVYEDAPPLKISAPYIYYLQIDVPMSRRRKLEVRNIPSHVRVDIVYSEGCPWDFTSVEAMGGAYELLESFQHVKKLHVGLQFFKVVAMLGLNYWQLPHSRRELLVVNSHNDYEHSVSGIIALLESSPNLETLIIDGPSAEREDVHLKPATRDDLGGDLLRLKTLKVRNFADSKGEPMLTLTRILLKRATALEEILVRDDVKDPSDMEEMVQTMLTYPRSSTKAVVRLVK